MIIINADKVSKYVNIKKEVQHKSFIKKIQQYIKPDKEKKYILNNCSFKISQGERIAILGLNGAGKSTIMKILSGAMIPSHGNIDVLGFKPCERKQEFLKKIGVVFGHKSSLIWDLPLIHSFILHKSIYEIEKKTFDSNLDYFLNLLDMLKCLNKKVRYLSLGERVKADLIMNLLHSPQILLLDEPTIGLDMEAKFQIRDFIANNQNFNNTTFIMTTHDPSDIEQCCEKILILNEGEFVFSSKVNEIKNKFNNKIRIMINKKEHNIDLSLLQNYLNLFPEIEFHASDNYFLIILDKSSELQIVQFLIEKNIRGFELKNMSFEEILSHQFRILNFEDKDYNEDE